MSDTDLFRLLACLALLLVAAHLFGRLFARLRQPPVVGEILGGLLLGPTLLGYFLPEVHGWLFPSSGPVASGLSLVYQLGLLLLMFIAGLEMRTSIERRNRRTIVLVTVIGMVIPFALGLVYVQTIDSSGIIGSTGNDVALILIVACAIAITSIPVISRIMMDLGIIRTPFARVVLAVAVLEDIALNVVISIALGMVAGARDEGFGAAAHLGIESAWGTALYHSLVTVAFFATVLTAALLLRSRHRSGAARPNRMSEKVPQVVALVLGVSALCVFLGIAPMFGAFSMGILLAWTSGPHESEAIGALRSVASGFLIPIYFAVVGLKLNLLEDFSLWLTLSFAAFACLAKAASVYLGARVSGEPPLGAWNLSVALNARGGPGIILATLAYDADIVSGSMFTTLILTAIITSLLAGVWLDAVVSRGLLEPGDPSPQDRVPQGPFAASWPDTPSPKTPRTQQDSHPESRIQ